MPVTAESVRWAYRLFLGREPLPGDAADDKTGFDSHERLAHHFLRVDEEFRTGAHGRLIAAADYHPDPRRFDKPRWRRFFARNNVVSRRGVHWAYRLFLGREPESEWVIQQKLKAIDDIDLVRTFFHSAEFAHRSSDWSDDFGNDEEGGLPLPPLRLRRTVGPTERSSWDNADGGPVFGDEVPPASYRAVFDFGCGCGRTARQLARQVHPPQVYVGVDLNPQSIDWCRKNFTPAMPAFTFFHLNAYNAMFNPGGERGNVTFPAVNRQFSLVNAHSVFTHVLEPNLDHYLGECARVLSEGGTFRATWFLFDKTVFPMMQESQNSLYCNLEDPSNAVIYDFRFVEARYRHMGLLITRILPPAVQGFHWVLVAEKHRPGLAPAHFPQDAADKGVVRPPRH